MEMQSLRDVCLKDYKNELFQIMSKDLFSGVKRSK